MLRGASVERLAMTGSLAAERTPELLSDGNDDFILHIRRRGVVSASSVSPTRSARRFQLPRLRLICLNAGGPRSAPSSGPARRATIVERTYLIQHLTQHRVDQVYPLVLLARPRFSLEAWRQFCATRTEEAGAASQPQAGILVAVNKAGHVRGLLSYRVSSLVPARHVLCIDLLAFAHLFRPEEVLEQMLDEAEAIGTAWGCRAIEVEAEDLGEWLDRADAERKLPVRVLRKVR
jgi:hypothetical protein